MRIMLIGVLALTLAGCKEQHETEAYQAGYDEGYEDGRFEACLSWRRALPEAIYSQYVPGQCR